MIYYTTEKIGPKRSLTPEGYLLCQEVPIARTGEMYYASTELPHLDAGRDGIIRITRQADDVFTEETRASFEGKPVSDDHPTEDITSQNWRQYACGTVQNVRRDGELLVADMLITVDPVIREVIAGKREVSCGYSADYEQIEAGEARQFNILGNHVAIVKAGRCGPVCAIGDSKMAARKTRAARILEAVEAKDADALEETIGASMPEIHVHTHLTRDADDPEPDAEKEKTEDADPEPDDDKDDEKEKTADEDPIAALTERVDRIDDSIRKMRDSIARFVKDDAGEVEPAVELEQPGSDEGNLESLEKPPVSIETPIVVGDSRALADEFRETLSVAEILAPGIGLPTFDAKTSSKKTTDALCALRRRALRNAFADVEKRKTITKVLAGRKPAFDAMTCDAVYGVFVGAGALVRDANNRRPYTGVTFSSTQDRKPASVEDFAAKAAAMWARK